MSAGIIPAPFC